MCEQPPPPPYYSISTAMSALQDGFQSGRYNLRAHTSVYTVRARVRVYVCVCSVPAGVVAVRERPGGFTTYRTPPRRRRGGGLKQRKEMNTLRTIILYCSSRTLCWFRTTTCTQEEGSVDGGECPIVEQAASIIG